MKRVERYAKFKVSRGTEAGAELENPNPSVNEARALAGHNEE